MELYGPRHRDTLRAGNLMALAARPNRTRAGGGDARDGRILRRHRRVFGAADPITLESAERLGVILWHLGKTELAEAVLRKNVDDRRRVYSSPSIPTRYGPFTS